jgi:hypothetical protein
MAIIKQTIIERLESDGWESISPDDVSIELAKEILAGYELVDWPYQLIARIQILLVEAGRCTDQDFLEAVGIEPTLHQALAARGYRAVNREGLRGYQRAILDDSGVEVFKGTARDVWAWLRDGDVGLIEEP